VPLPGFFLLDAVFLLDSNNYGRSLLPWIVDIKSRPSQAEEKIAL